MPGFSDSMCWTGTECISKMGVREIIVGLGGKQESETGKQKTENRMPMLYGRLYLQLPITDIVTVRPTRSKQATATTSSRIEYTNLRCHLRPSCSSSEYERPFSRR